MYTVHVQQYQPSMQLYQRLIRVGTTSICFLLDAFWISFLQDILPAGEKTLIRRQNLLHVHVQVHVHLLVCVSPETRDFNFPMVIGSKLYLPPFDLFNNM